MTRIMLGGIEKKTHISQGLCSRNDVKPLSEIPFQNKFNQNMGKVDNMINFHSSSSLPRTSFLLLRGKGEKTKKKKKKKKKKK